MEKTSWKLKTWHVLRSLLLAYAVTVILLLLLALLLYKLELDEGENLHWNHCRICALLLCRRSGCGESKPEPKVYLGTFGGGAVLPRAGRGFNRIGPRRRPHPPDGDDRCTVCRRRNAWGDAGINVGIPWKM